MIHHKTDREIRQYLTEIIVSRMPVGQSLSDRDLRRIILHTVTEHYAGIRISLRQKERMADLIYAQMRGFDVLQPMLDNQSVTEIMVNGPDNIYCEINGRIHKTDLCFDSQEHLESFVRRCFGKSDRLINEKTPMADMRLADGSRIHAVLKPTALQGPYVCIRKFTGIKPQVEKLVESGFLAQEFADYLEQAVINRKNIFISGGTGTGKTTFLNALSGFIPASERVITIEDSAELDLQGIPDLVRLEARQAAPDGTGEITLSDLIRSSLRMRPDRIIVGEVRGSEAYDMIQAMNTGHPGSMSTGHGNNCRDMLERLSLMIIMHSSLPWEACRRLVANAVDLVVHIARNADGTRLVKEAVLLDGYAGGQFMCSTIYGAKGDK